MTPPDATQSASMPDQPAAAEVEALVSALLDCRWPDGGYEGMPTRVTAKMIAASLLNRGYLSPAEHERLVAAARSAERERIAAAIQRGHDPERPNDFLIRRRWAAAVARTDQAEDGAR